MFKKVVALLIILSLAFVSVSCDGEEGESPDSSLTRFIEMWAQGNWSGMYQLLTEKAKESCDEETFIARYSNISSGIGLAGLKLAEVNLNEDQLQYTLDFTTTTVGSFSFSYTLEAVQEDGNWRLNWGHQHIFPELTGDRVVRVSRQIPKRGSILDRNKVALASMDTVYSIGLVPGKMNESSTTALALLLDRSESDIVKLLNQSWVRDDTFVPVQTIGENSWSQLREALSALNGVTTREVTSRVYNHPHSLAQTVGYVGEIEAERLGELSQLGFVAGDTMGQTGLELVYDLILAGEPGFLITIRDEDNNVISEVASREPVDGNDIVTTLDIAKCQLLDSTLGERKGSLLLMNFLTGDILGVVSKPGFDNNLFALGITPAQYGELMELDTPFFNRAFNGLYPPGSILKPFTALMALEEGVVDPDYSWDTPRHWQKSSDWGAYQVTRVVRPLGPVNLWDAMKWSDNVYFADLGLKVGWQAFEKYGDALGFSTEIPFSLNHQKSQIRNTGSGEVLLADSSYGQGEMLATPLHMALMYSAIARQDGKLPFPRLIGDGPGDTWLSTGFSPENLELVDRVLAYAASDQGALAWVGHETVRGKTGTSEISGDRQIAWYICYFDNLLLAVNLEGDRNLSSMHAVALARECLSGLRD